MTSEYTGYSPDMTETEYNEHILAMVNAGLEIEKLGRCGKSGKSLRKNDQEKQNITLYCGRHDCDNCRPRRAIDDRKRIAKKCDLITSSNENIKIRIRHDVPKEDREALNKRINRANGAYTQYGGYYIIAIEDVYSDDKMTTVFGEVAKPRTVVNANDVIVNTTYLNRLGNQEDYEMMILNGNGNHNWSGKLHQVLTKTEKKQYRLRYTEIITHTEADYIKLQHEPVQFSTTLVHSLDELQDQLQKLEIRDINQYREAGIKFKTKTCYRYVDETAISEWNKTAIEKLRQQNVRVYPTNSTGVSRVKSDILDNKTADSAEKWVQGEMEMA